MAPVANNGTFGAHFWVNGTPAEGQFQPLRPGLELFLMSGAAGQYVLIVPARDLVVVRLGEMHAAAWSDLGGPLSDLVLAFPELAR